MVATHAVNLFTMQSMHCREVVPNHLYRTVGHLLPGHTKTDQKIFYLYYFKTLFGKDARLSHRLANETTKTFKKAELAA